MRVVIQRVTEASVMVNGLVVGQINDGLMVLVGFETADNTEDLNWMTGKITQLRIFNDDAGVMNKSLLDTGGELLLVSQFTLHASTKKGNRPSYIIAAKPEVAIPLYEMFIQLLTTTIGKQIQSGVFGADMKVSLVNDGPVTIVIDSKNRE